MQKPTRFLNYIEKNSIIATIIISIFIYHASIYNYIVWDDLVYIPNIQKFDNKELLAFLTTPFLFSQSYFRPLPLSLIVVETSVGGAAAPIVMHAVSLLLHACNAALVVALTRIFMRSQARQPGLYPLMAGLLYASHTALLEGVVWISCYFDLMATCFMLWGLLAESALRKPSGRIAAVAAAFFFAALCKESAVAFPVILFLWQRATGRREPLGIFVGLFLAGLLYLALRVHFLGGLGLVRPTIATYIDRHGTAVQHVLLILHQLGHYALLLISPLTLPDPQHVLKFPVATTDPLGWATLCLCAGLAVFALYRRKKPNGLVLLVLAGIAGILPVLDIGYMRLGYCDVADRFMILPLCLISIACASGLEQGVGRLNPRLQPVLLLGYAAWFVISIVIIEATIPFWHDNITFWRWLADTHPDAAQVWENLAASYNKAGRTAEGLAAAEKGIAVAPWWEKPKLQLDAGFALGIENRPQDAIDIMVQALATVERMNVRPVVWVRAEPERDDRFLLLNNIAASYVRLGDYDRAESHYRAALRLYPDQPVAVRQLNKVLCAKAGRPHCFGDDPSKMGEQMQPASNDRSRD